MKQVTATNLEQVKQMIHNNFNKNGNQVNIHRLEIYTGYITKKYTQAKLNELNTELTLLQSLVSKQLKTNQRIKSYNLQWNAFNIFWQTQTQNMAAGNIITTNLKDSNFRIDDTDPKLVCKSNAKASQIESSKAKQTLVAMNVIISCSALTNVSILKVENNHTNNTNDEKFKNKLSSGLIQYFPSICIPT